MSGPGKKISLSVWGGPIKANVSVQVRNLDSTIVDVLDSTYMIS